MKNDRVPQIKTMKLSPTAFLKHFSPTSQHAYPKNNAANINKIIDIINGIPIKSK